LGRPGGKTAQGSGPSARVAAAIQGSVWGPVSRFGIAAGTYVLPRLKPPILAALNSPLLTSRLPLLLFCRHDFCYIISTSTFPNPCLLASFLSLDTFCSSRTTPILYSTASPLNILYLTVDTGLGGWRHPPHSHFVAAFPQSLVSECAELSSRRATCSSFDHGRQGAS
jgi:hypothetical protein